MSESLQADVVVIGSGPGGYTAAFRAADLGLKVVLVEYYDSLGGVCLNVGCIPSKALLHAAKVITESQEAKAMGISLGKPKVDIAKLRAWVQDKAVGRLTGGLSALAKQRKVKVMHGRAEFLSEATVTVTGTDAKTTNVDFKNAIIATGSSPIKLPFLPDDERIMDSTAALELRDLPSSMLVIGGGIIGMELGTVYAALGTAISVVELTDGIMPGVDPDLAKPLQKRMEQHFQEFMLGTKVQSVEALKTGLKVKFIAKDGSESSKTYDKILSCVGRSPNSKDLGLDKAGVKVDDRGFVPVDKQQRTNVANIFAIGDVCSNPMLAHKAIPQGKIAAEVIAGQSHYFEPKCIASVAYTDPEVAWVGVTELQAKAEGIEFEKAVFPWMASGRALANGREEGLTKLLVDKKTRRVIGAGIVGIAAGDLIAEAALAIEMGCDVQDIALTIHPHPTLAESIAQSAEIIEGSITDLYMPKK